MNRRNNLLIVFLLMLTQVVSAQKLTVESMTVAANDISASQYERKDLNRQPCALVKVLLASSGAVFEGNVIQPVKYDVGEYWVYMTAGSKELRIKHPQAQPVQVVFKEYGIERLTAKTTYSLSVLLPRASQSSSSSSSVSGAAVEKITVNGVSFNMVRVEGGSFKMGDNSFENSRPVHKVTLSDYYIGETEVTQALWQAVMGSNPSSLKGANLPVDCVSWNDCQEFIQKLSKQSGHRFRLPTEAEWEYAARGGNKSHGYPWAGSNDFNSVALFGSNSIYSVGTKQSNELGIYDMSGNVCEWCQDWYGKYSRGSQVNPVGPLYGEERVNRGGCFFWDLESCMCTLRASRTPSYPNSGLGLRLAF